MSTSVVAIYVMFLLLVVCSAGGGDSDSRHNNNKDHQYRGWNNSAYVEGMFRGVAPGESYKYMILLHPLPTVIISL